MPTSLSLKQGFCPFVLPAELTTSSPASLEILIAPFSHVFSEVFSQPCLYGLHTAGKKLLIFRNNCHHGTLEGGIFGFNQTPWVTSCISPVWSLKGENLPVFALEISVWDLAVKSSPERRAQSSWRNKHTKLFFNHRDSCKHFLPFSLLIYLQNMLSPHPRWLLAALLLPWLSVELHPHSVPRPGRSPHISKEKGWLLPVHLSPQQLGSCWPGQPSTVFSFFTWEGRQMHKAPGELNSLSKYIPYEHSAGW